VCQCVCVCVWTGREKERESSNFSHTRMYSANAPLPPPSFFNCFPQAIADVMDMEEDAATDARPDLFTRFPPICGDLKGMFPRDEHVDAILAKNKVFAPPNACGGSAYQMHDRV